MNNLSYSTGLSFTLDVSDKRSNAFVVVSFTLEEQYSHVFLLELELASEDHEIDFGAVLDSHVTLTIWRDAVIQRRVHGIVVSMDQGDTGFRRTRYSLSVRPALWRASLVKNSRIFQQQNIQAVLETLLCEHGISDYVFSLRHKHSAREFCVQYQEDNLSFIQRMCAEEGIFYFFEHENNKHTLVFSDDVGVLNKGPVLPYSHALDQELCITNLRRRESLRPSEVLLKDYTFKNPPWGAEYSEEARDIQHQSQSYLYYDYPGRYKDDVGKSFSRWRIEALRNDAHLGEGISNCSALQPGFDFTLIGHPRAEMNTRWQIISVTHHGKQPQALEEESGEQGTTVSNQFSFIPCIQTWRPLPGDKVRIDGAQIAIVTGPPGEEIYCDKYGRVRVKFLWDRSGNSDDSSSCWIRVSHPWAGAGWGSLAIPRIGHEVIVEFLNGDPDQPVIIGRTYHANHLPPGGLPGTKTQMSLRSQTHKGSGFNELRFEDEKGMQEVYIHAQRDMNICVLHDRSTDVKNNHTEMVHGSQFITIGKNQTLTVKQDRNKDIVGNEVVNINGEQKITIDKDQTLIVKKNRSKHIVGDEEVTTDGKQKVDVKGSYTLIVESDSCKIERGGASL